MGGGGGGVTQIQPLLDLKLWRSSPSQICGDPLQRLANPLTPPVGGAAVALIPQISGPSEICEGPEISEGPETGSEISDPSHLCFCLC